MVDALKSEVLLKSRHVSCNKKDTTTNVNSKKEVSKLMMIQTIKDILRCTVYGMIFLGLFIVFIMMVTIFCFLCLTLPWALLGFIRGQNWCWWIFFKMFNPPVFCFSAYYENCTRLMLYFPCQLSMLSTLIFWFSYFRISFPTALVWRCFVQVLGVLGF